jgi:hypothetical protein
LTTSTPASGSLRSQLYHWCITGTERESDETHIGLSMRDSIAQFDDTALRPEGQCGPGTIAGAQNPGFKQVPANPSPSIPLHAHQ